MNRYNILLKSHYSGIPGGPVDNFYSYFSKKSNVCIIKHPLFLKKGLKSEIATKNKTITFSLPSTIQWMLEGVIECFLLVLKFPDFRRPDLIVCFDPLSFINSYLFGWIIKPNKTVYYNLDYSKKRFNNKVLNFLYTHLDSFAYHHSTYFFSFSKKYIQEQGIRGKNKENIFLAHNTVDLTEINIHAPKIKNSLVYAGVIDYPSIDFEPLLRALSELKKEKFIFTFHIYGATFTNKLRNLIDRYELSKEVLLKDTVNHSRLVNTILPQYSLGVCPYTLKEKKSAPDHLYSGTDLPAKLIDYIAAGLPVVSTEINKSINIIETNKFGVVVNNTPDWKNAIKKILTDKKLYESYRSQALQYVQTYDTNLVLNNIFKKIL